MTNELHECYRTLDLEHGASLADAKRSYRELVTVWHPDRFVHDPILQKKAEEKLKHINIAFETLRKHFARQEATPAPPRLNTDIASAEELFRQGEALFCGRHGTKDTVRAALLLRKAAEIGFAPAQYLLGCAYYSGEGVLQSQKDACSWWTKAAEQLHADAQCALGALYHNGYKADALAKVVKTAVGWQPAEATLEAYKWLNLAITYGAGRNAGLIMQRASEFLTGKALNEARRRAATFYPKYAKQSSEEVFDKLFDWFLEETNSPDRVRVQKFYFKIQGKAGGVENLRSEIREKALEDLRSVFLGDTATKVTGFLKTAGALWNPIRSREDWGRFIAAGILKWPYEDLSDTFIRRRENAINHIWLNLVNDDNSEL